MATDRKGRDSSPSPGPTRASASSCHHSKGLRLAAASRQDRSPGHMLKGFLPLTRTFPGFWTICFARFHSSEWRTDGCARPPIGVRRKALRRTYSKRGATLVRAAHFRGRRRSSHFEWAIPVICQLCGSGARLHWPTAYQLARAADWSASDPEMAGGLLVPAVTESRTNFPCLQSCPSANPEIACWASGLAVGESGNSRRNCLFR